MIKKDPKHVSAEGLFWLYIGLFWLYIIHMNLMQKEVKIMIALGIIFAVMSIACVILQWTGTWIDTHDKRNATERKLKTVILIHIILVSPIWLVQIIVHRIKTLIERRRNHEQS